mmetsp:Transcript_15248/g.18555  ORF Transcript_15248/g.18555 Transcript_15248/m.18555 type:complete len:396 (-) Transcript_15248:74-1261(-)
MVLRSRNKQNNKGGQEEIHRKENVNDSNGLKQEKVPPKFKVWILASRPHTLTASVAPVLVGVALVTHCLYNSIPSESAGNHQSYLTLGVYFGVFACLIQLGTNLHNDYADFIKGADTESRVGQARATQKGWLTPKETACGSSLCLLGAAIIGIYLTLLSSSVDVDYYMIFVTISSVFNAFCYTGGEYPLGYIGLGKLSIGYSGLGDLFVFLYFGLVATITVPYLYLRSIHDHQQQSSMGNGIYNDSLIKLSLMVALPVGFLATAIIAVNNLRDRKTDIIVRKNTMAVRFGEMFTRLEYTILVVASYIMLVPLSSSLVKVLISGDNYPVNYQYARMCLFLPLLSFPLAWKELKAVGFGGKDGAALNQHVGGTARVQLFYCILLIFGMNISRRILIQ